MLRSIIAIIVSYVAMFVLFMVLFTGLYFAFGVERVFQPDSYEVSALWLVVTLIGALLGAMFGGYLCATISKSWRTCQVFALIAFLLALVQCLSDLRSKNPDAPNVRAGDVPFPDGIKLGVTPLWFHFVNPLVGGIGALLGARVKRRGDT
ncbi:MAG TPA: hypothetical protein VM940_15735 [Chthoniobacterales bacterium]|jgi:peptidoglycan/LPS O-acetylase OafA/YrhL|nr:hypothetical protein [Chthoniobacterales bacterium]